MKSLEPLWSPDYKDTVSATQLKRALTARFLFLAPKASFILEMTVGYACQYRDQGVRQGETTRRAPARKEEQRRMAP